jgi:murein DD-endopeptidase MepM/ murein hydrolase activator NlpD
MNKVVSLLIFLPFSLLAYGQEDPSLRDLKAGRYTADTSFVYLLPFQGGKSYFLVQAYQSNLSHKGEYALDFKMKEGTTVCAARGGVVEGLRQDSKAGGLKPEMLSEGNYVIIRHPDGSQGLYWHLQQGSVRVAVGDTVEAGQPLGRSGNTGYSAFPHLHFEVVHPVRGQVPTRFHTSRGVRYLRPGRWHRAG